MWTFREVRVEKQQTTTGTRKWDFVENHKLKLIVGAASDDLTSIIILNPINSVWCEYQMKF